MDAAHKGRTPLQCTAESLFADIGDTKKPSIILSHFSTTQTVILQHDCVDSTTPHMFIGLHAVRSYFDLLALHWTRDDMQLYHCDVHADKQQVVIKASVQWTWKVSKKSWREDFTCTLDFDEQLKVKGFIVRSSPPATNCIMRAIDSAPI